MFSSTEIDFVKEVVDEVVDIWQPTIENKIIINLPATVEMNTPNTYADQIEWMHRNLNQRDCIVLSVHPHNDRGTAVAAAELALMAGADRIEGCLFGNGERTGNVDIVTLAMNMYSQGVSPELDFSDIDQVRKLVEECNQLPVHPRHPYAGELVYTAFSGSHQDAIKKGMAVQNKDGRWRVPYLPIDPADVGRGFEAVVRVNSQSGKGGVAFLLEQEANLQLPRKLQIEFSRTVQRENDSTGKEMSAKRMKEVFEQEYFDATTPFAYTGSTITSVASGEQSVSIQFALNNEVYTIEGTGNGPVEAAANALSTFLNKKVEVADYHEHAVGEGAGVKAVCYIEVKLEGADSTFGCASDSNIITAAIKALLSGVNRLM